MTKEELAELMIGECTVILINLENLLNDIKKIDINDFASLHAQKDILFHQNIAFTRKSYWQKIANQE
jgi:hypothetical protein